MDNFEYAKKCGNSILSFMMIDGDGRMSTELLYNYLSYNSNIIGCNLLDVYLALTKLSQA